MIEITAYGEIKNGAFFPRNSRFYLQQMKDAGNVSECVLTIKGSNKRTADQNSYAHVVCQTVAHRLNQDGWDFSSYEIYKKLENDKCKALKRNEKTGKTHETILPLKKMDRVRFFDIVEAFRVDMMQKLQIEIQTPAQHYGITEEAYDLWKNSLITFVEAKRMSEKTEPKSKQEQK